MLTIEQTLAEIDRQIVLAERLADEVASDRATTVRDAMRSLDTYYMASEVLTALKAKIKEG